MRSIEQIEALRKEHRITRLALYTRAGIHHSTYCELARGDRKPNVRTLEKLDAAIVALAGPMREPAE